MATTKTKTVKKVYTYAATPAEKKQIEKNAKKAKVSISSFIVDKCAKK